MTGQEIDEKKPADVVKIDPIPANAANNLAWILFLLPTFVVLVFFYSDDAKGPRSV